MSYSDSNPLYHVFKNKSTLLQLIRKKLFHWKRKQFKHLALFAILILNWNPRRTGFFTRCSFAFNLLTSFSCIRQCTQSVLLTCYSKCNGQQAVHSWPRASEQWPDPDSWQWDSGPWCPHLAANFRRLYRQNQGSETSFVWLRGGPLQYTKQHWQLV